MSPESGSVGVTGGGVALAPATSCVVPAGALGVAPEGKVCPVGRAGDGRIAEAKDERCQERLSFRNVSPPFKRGEGGKMRATRRAPYGIISSEVYALIYRHPEGPGVEAHYLPWCLGAGPARR